MAKSILRAAFAVSAVVLASQAMAQVVLYEHEGFRGRSVAVNGEMRNVERRALGNTAQSAVVERGRWTWPSHTTWAAIWYNAIPIFVFAHAAWFWLARGLPPVASTISVMFIPVLGVLTGALWLGEALHWQDWAAVLLIASAIALVMLPSRRA